MLLNFKNKFSGMKLIGLGFVLIILIGSLLLMLPITSRSGECTPFLTALFTATSATCVTGLVLVDTFSYWSVWGQLVILLLIQIGGLGFITFGVSVSLLLRKKIGLQQRGLIRESFSVLEIGGAVRLVKRVVKGTAFFEGIGAILLATRFIPKMGIIQGIYYAIFHSVSAFCNAGFDLMGRYKQFSSFTAYYDDPLVVLTLASLIIIGGIGFFVWNDIWQNKFHFRRYALQTKMVLSMTFVLVIGGAFLFYLIEKNALYADMSTSGKLLSSLFSSVTPRTAGFNTVDTGSLSDTSKLLTIILMFIGGSPGSTAGGVKVTTIFVMILFLQSTLSRTNGTNVYGRRLEDSVITKAASVFCINLFAGLTASLVICGIQGFNLTDVSFEVFSAISTVGMSAGITGSLNTVSKFIIIFLMYIGRVGSLSFALSFTDKKKQAHILLPVERINVG